MSQDYWDWVDQKKPIAPLAAAIQPSQEQSPGVMQQPKDPIVGMAQQAGVNAAAKGAEAAYKAYGAAANPVGPLTANQLGTSFAADMAAQGVASTALPMAAEAAATTGTLGTAAGVGGEAALAAMGPVGWAIGAGLLAKKLGIF